MRPELIMRQENLISFVRNQFANIGLTWALISLPVIAILAVGLEQARKSSAELELQRSLDSATLWAAQQIRLGDLPSESSVFERFTMYAGEHHQEFLRQRAKFEFSYIAGDGDRRNSVWTNFEPEMRSVFGQVLGQEAMHLNLVANASFSPIEKVEIVLVLDSSASMQSPLGGQSRITVLKNSVYSLIDFLGGSTARADSVKIAAIPFNSYVSIDESVMGADWLTAIPEEPAGASWRGCIGTRESPYNESNSDYETHPVPIMIDPGEICLPPMFSLSSIQGSPNTNIHQMVSGLRAGGRSTYIPAALIWALRILQPGEPFPGAASPEEFQRNGGRKVVVLFSDGGNLAGRANNGRHLPCRNGRAHPEGFIACKRNADALTLRLCDKISVVAELHVIALVENDPESLALLNRCASSNEYFHSVSSAMGLHQAFQAVGLALSKISLIQ